MKLKAVLGVVWMSNSKGSFSGVIYLVTLIFLFCFSVSVFASTDRNVEVTFYPTATANNTLVPYTVNVKNVSNLQIGKLSLYVASYPGYIPYYPSYLIDSNSLRATGNKPDAVWVITTDTNNGRIWRINLDGGTSTKLKTNDDLNLYFTALTPSTGPQNLWGWTLKLQDQSNDLNFFDWNGTITTGSNFPDLHDYNISPVDVSVDQNVGFTVFVYNTGGTNHGVTLNSQSTITIPGTNFIAHLNNTPFVPYGGTSYAGLTFDSNSIPSLPKGHYLPVLTLYGIGEDGNTYSQTFTMTSGINVGNTSPVAPNLDVNTLEDTLVVFSTGAYDPNGDAIICSAGDITNAHGTVTVTSCSNISYTPESNYNGTTTFTYNVDDNYGATSTGTVTMTVISVNDTPVANAGGPYSAEIGSPITFDGSASSDIDGNIVLYEWDVNGDSIYDINSVTPTVTYTYNSAGDFNVVLRVTDNEGAMSTATTTATVSDITPPVFDSNTVFNISGVEATGASGAVVDYNLPTASDNSGDVVVVCVPIPGSIFPLGTTTVTCTATDDSNNSTTIDFNITVVDTTPPVIDSMSNITGVEATSSAGAVVTYTSPAANDLVDGVTTATCLPTSGSTFSLGDNTVTCIATDAAGNSAVPVVFTINIVDTTPPTINVPANIEVNAVDASGTIVEFGSITATDIVDGTIVLDAEDCNATSGSIFPLGTTSVQCSLTDAHGNTGTNSFDITVVDANAPVVTVPEDITTEATSAGGATVTFEVSATDNVDGSITPVCDTPSGSTFPIGTTIVTCTATDSSNNSSSNHFDVTVVDTTPPELTLPANITVVANTLGGASVSFSVTATDLVDGVIGVACSPVSG
jgi:hypothetical protein